MAANLFTSNFNSQGRPILYFFYKLALLFLLVAVLDFAIGSALQYLYFRTTSGQPYRVTYALDKTSQDILVFGSSRAMNHYVPDVFEKNLKMSCYNTGEGGRDIFFHLAILRAVLKRYVPKVIVLDMQLGDLVENKDSYDKLAILSPYYRSHPEIRDIIALRGSFEKIKLLSQVYPFNSMVLSIIAGNFEMNKKRRGDVKGYMPLAVTKDSKVFFEYRKGQDAQVGDKKTNAYIEFLVLSVKAGSKVFVVISPEYAKLEHDKKIMEVLTDIAAKYGVAVLDYSRKEFFLDHPELFRDEEHLNENGAEIFSDMISRDMRSRLRI